MSYCILSFCGGGIRGLLSAGWLSVLNAAAEKQSISLIKNTNLLAGTSTGGDIISMLMAGMTPAMVYDTYKYVAPKAFEFTNFDPTLPAYDNAGLVKAQNNLHPGGKTLNEYTDHSVLFTSFNVGKSEGQPWGPVLFNNLKNYNAGNYSIADAAVASSLMPGMYGSINGYVDGAFVSHDPTLSAISLAVANGTPLTDIVAICFGTGLMPNWIASDTSNWGAQQWQQGDGNPNSQIPPLLINGTVSPVLNMSLDGTSTSLTQQLCGMLLGERYVYVNTVLDKIIPENDILPADLQYMEECVTNQNMDAAEALLPYWQ